MHSFSLPILANVEYLKVYNSVISSDNHWTVLSTFERVKVTQLICKGKGKIHSRTGHEDPEEEQK